MPESHTPLVTLSSILEQEKSGFLGKKKLFKKLKSLLRWFRFVSPLNVITTLNVIPTVNVAQINAKSNANRKCNKL